MVEINKENIFFFACLNIVNPILIVCFRRLARQQHTEVTLRVFLIYLHFCLNYNFYCCLVISRFYLISSDVWIYIIICGLIGNMMGNIGATCALSGHIIIRVFSAFMISESRKGQTNPFNYTHCYTQLFWFDDDNSAGYRIALLQMTFCYQLLYVVVVVRTYCRFARQNLFLRCKPW